MRTRKKFLTIMKNNGNTVTVRTICTSCNSVKFFELDMTEYQKWLDGKLIQDSFPELSDDDRECLISGICPSCWESYLNGTTTKS